MSDSRLRTELPRQITLRDPLLLASGCCGYGEEWGELVDLPAIGGVITKAVSLESRDGNATPRLRETHSGLLNSIGLQNPGVSRLITDVLPRLDSLQLTYLVNIVGHTAQEFAAVTSKVCVAASKPGRLADGTSFGCCGIELDLSCPNVESGTLFATDEAVLRQTIELCRLRTDLLLVAKLSPNVTDIVPYARAAQESGADAVTIANTWLGMSIDIHSRRSHLARPFGGLSGAAIHPATLYHVWRCHRALPDLPIIASGGISDGDGAIQYLLAGATALQLGTGLFCDPGLPGKIQRDMVAYLDAQHEPDLAVIRGGFKE
jgi:dihydroorotate dehydrogenase (NAD+) catalytic subunit